jgi:GNAT superfamily N-acetyltransferase
VTWTRTFEELDTGAHDRDSFDCGEAPLNEFIKTKAARHMKVGVSRTMVLPTVDRMQNGKCRIAAFYTIAPSSVEREDLPEALAKRLPRYPVPVFLIAQLAVHREAHGHGLGRVTLARALDHLLGVNGYLHAYAVVVDCLTESARPFYEKYGFQDMGIHNGHRRMFIPMKQLAGLGV